MRGPLEVTDMVLLVQTFCRSHPQCFACPRLCNSFKQTRGPFVRYICLDSTHFSFPGSLLRRKFIACIPPRMEGFPAQERKSVSSAMSTSGRSDGCSFPAKPISTNDFRNIESNSSKGDFAKVRKKGGKKEGKGKISENKIDALGRLMTKILRHKAKQLRLNIRSDGFVEVNELLNLREKTFARIPLCSHSLDDVKEAVKNDNKQRFTLLEENGRLLIRANQGHSIDVINSEDLFKPITSVEEVPVCVHGTYKKNLDSILKNGLSRMQRRHVHFATGLPHDDGVISGMRGNCDILIHLDVEKALKDGMKLYLSDNNVLLTEGFDGIVPTSYLKKIETWPDRKQIF
eukprot:TRINITY_DN1771_c0_g1_i2.p1 TRINITY_DN1771_c0_g1~~TRINITY_DN1771_c0_g1_i2.p1  ORF type:complete len:345 (-),score=59.47 TRINITY_DN1771_c0_g1_i2:122-1156(-)